MTDDLGPENLLHFATGRSAISGARDAVFEAIEERENDHENGAPVAEVLEAATDDAALTDCLFSLRQMLQRGEVYRPRSGSLRTVDQKEPVDVSAPEIVCLCGSTRFEDAYKDEQFRLTVEEQAIVLTVAGNWKDDHDDAWGEIDAEDKERLDELHFKKIDLADRVHVLNVDGYVGESTRNEIEFAIRNRTPVTWLEPENVPEEVIEHARGFSQVKETIPKAAVCGPDVSAMSIEELREERQELNLYELQPHRQPYLWERAHNLWDELVERTDVEQPECPECGARSWGGGFDGAPFCRECEASVSEEMGVDPAELEQRIVEAHKEIGTGGESA